MIERTHSALLPNCLLLVAEIYFIVLMATGIYKHNPGRRAFQVMYREVRAFLPPWRYTSETSHLSSQGLLWLVTATLVEIVPIVSRVYSLLLVDGVHSL
jgi:hypothetical protein